jgi:hypothetical protein
MGSILGLDLSLLFGDPFGLGEMMIEMAQKREMLVL